MNGECVARLTAAGIDYADAVALRRISMTLHRWHELECGDGNAHGSWCITRGRKMRHCSTPNTFLHDDDGAPFLERHHYLHGRGTDYVTYTPLSDRERGARKRLAMIMAKYPGFVAYVQTDPRGCALYILQPDDVKVGCDVSEYYSRGIAVYK